MNITSPIISISPHSINSITKSMGSCKISKTNIRISFPNISKKLIKIPLETVTSISSTSHKSPSILINQNDEIEIEKRKISNELDKIKKSKGNSSKANINEKFTIDNIKKFCKIFNIKTVKQTKNELIELLVNAIDQYNFSYKISTNNQTINTISPSKQLHFHEDVIVKNNESDDESEIEFDPDED